MGGKLRYKAYTCTDPSLDDFLDRFLSFRTVVLCVFAIRADGCRVSSFALVAFSHLSILSSHCRS